MERELLAAIAAAPDDVQARLVYADWLEDRGDRRAHHVRAELALHELPVDHPQRLEREIPWNRTRAGLDPAWLVQIERSSRSSEQWCTCFQGRTDDGKRTYPPLALHDDVQDTEHDDWKRLCDHVEDIAAKKWDQFWPFETISHEHIYTLPPTIAKLTDVRDMNLYGSKLRRLPREVGQMTSLVKFTPYTSYWLHWYPYEITRCPALRSSTVSTRALYGNYKFHPPFPALAPRETPLPPRPCSVCDALFPDYQRYRLWISLRVGSDILPLLVNACSAECVAKLPAPPEGYAPEPHRGGPATGRDY